MKADFSSSPFDEAGTAAESGVLFEAVWLEQINESRRRTLL